MASNMQRIIMDELENRLDVDGFNLVVNTEMANTGIMWAVPDGQFSSRYSLHYNFQSNYASFEHSEQGGSGLRLRHKDKNFGIWYDRGEEKFTTELERIVQFLEGNIDGE